LLKISCLLVALNKQWLLHFRLCCPHSELQLQIDNCNQGHPLELQDKEAYMNHFPIWCGLISSKMLACNRIECNWVHSRMDKQ
jgi:hypothetical protein